jgi:hypothetical protein
MATNESITKVDMDLYLKDGLLVTYMINYKDSLMRPMERRFSVKCI